MVPRTAKYEGKLKKWGGSQAIGRQLMVDLWRLQTGRVTAQELNLIMVTD
jgi:hypothetical protein